MLTATCTSGSAVAPLALRYARGQPRRPAAVTAAAAARGLAAHHPRRPLAVTVAATPPSNADAGDGSGGKGFSTTTSANPKAQKKPRSGGRGALRRTEQGARLAPPKPTGSGEWVRLATLAEWRPGKAAKAVILPDGSPLVLYRVGGGDGSEAGKQPLRLYASDAYSTAFKYPLVDADVALRQDGRVVVTSGFDGTEFDLRDGSVVAWCPSNTPVRSLLGALKSKTAPTPLTVYPARLSGDGQGVEVWFAR